MEDFNSKYSGEQVEALLDQVASGNAGGGGGGGITVETDPIFSASPAAAITEDDIAMWNGAADLAAGHDTDISQLFNDIEGKQDAISDLATIREGAANGTTAVQPASLANYVSKDDVDAELSVTSTNPVQNNVVFNAFIQIAHEFELGLELKQDVISDLEAIRDGASKGATALQEHQSLKTINGESIVGSGDITIAGGSGEKGEKGDKGDTGADGATFTPSVDSAGNLSWTNNKGLTNPPTVNIKGPKGDAGSGGGGGEDIRYFTDFAVEVVMAAAVGGTNITYNNIDTLIEAARTNKLICIPYANADSGYIVASYSFTDGVENNLKANFSILEGSTLYYFYIVYMNWAGGYSNYVVRGSHITQLSPYVGEIDVEDGFVEVLVVDNSVYIIYDIVEVLYVWPEGNLNVGTTIKFRSGENLTIEIPDCCWANGVSPIIEPNTTYELSLTSTNDGYLLAVLTPFKPVE